MDMAYRVPDSLHIDVLHDLDQAVVKGSDSAAISSLVSSERDFCVLRVRDAMIR
jgi:hypothetical protein